jgi:hypothetical protein
MTRSISLSAALAILGLGFTATSASAQVVYVEEYPIVAPESSYVVRQTVVAPPPIVRKRTVVVTRPAYVPAPVLRLPHYGYAEERYVVTDW